MATAESEYKGKPVLEVWTGDKRVVSFGVRKAQAILLETEAIRAFCEKHKNIAPEKADQTSPLVFRT